VLETNVILNGDCIQIMKTLPDNSVDAVVTDPPYGLEFMGKEWDKFAGIEEFSKKEQGGFGGYKTHVRHGKDTKGLQIFCYNWAKECLRVLKPGGHLLSFGGSRTYHRMACAIEDAGFEIRDQIMWLYGSGFPKSLNIGKQVDKILGNERSEVGLNPNHRKSDALFELGFQGGRSNGTLTKGTSAWEGWGTALKPAHEPIVVARKPLSEKNVALNVLKWGTAGINIDGCRVEYQSEKDLEGATFGNNSGLIKKDKVIYGDYSMYKYEEKIKANPQGRFPANIIFECICETDIEDGVHSNCTFNTSNKYHLQRGIHTNPNCPCRMLDEQSGISKSPQTYIRKTDTSDKSMFSIGLNKNQQTNNFGDKGGASRFFYCAKASKKERNAGLDGFEDKITKVTNMYEMERKDGTMRELAVKKNNHPTVKPIKLMRYLVRLVCRKGGVVLDPFLGSGTTAIACVQEGMKFIGIEKETEYIKIAEARLKPFMEQKRLGDLK